MLHHSRLLAALFLAIHPALAAIAVEPPIDWRGALSAWQSPEASTLPQAAQWLRVRQENGAYVVWTENPLAGPVQVRLKRQDAQQLPGAVVLHAGERVVLTRLLIDRIASNQPLNLQLDAVPGDPNGLADAYAYRVPFDNVPIRIDQGFNGAFSHHDDANRYALDFALPRDTPVLAAREGVVMEIQSGVQEQAADHRPDAQDGGGNLVRILHCDGSMAVYAHLSADGLAVRQGEHVIVGQRIGLSGNTGFSTAPHLHFAIQVNRGMHLMAVPFQMIGPLGTLRFPTSTP